MIPERITTHNSLLNYDAGAGEGFPGAPAIFQQMNQHVTGIGDRPRRRNISVRTSIYRAVRWRVVLEGTPDHTGLMPIGDIKSRIIWHNKKRFQLLAGSGNAILIKHPHGIPRLLERAQCGFGLL